MFYFNRGQELVKLHLIYGKKFVSTLNCKIDHQVLYAFFPTHFILLRT